MLISTVLFYSFVDYTTIMDQFRRVSGHLAYAPCNLMLHATKHSLLYLTNFVQNFEVSNFYYYVLIFVAVQIF